ncbi:MAG: glycosyltransferase family 2 protein [Acidobacteria bacterium]|nr:glycosyltransferase family 2 protein [Acidobacteriota bacterium]
MSSFGAVVVLYAQSDEEIASALDQLESLRPAPELVVLVSNAPDRDVSSFATRARVVEMGRNAGFCAGANRGLAELVEAGLERGLLMNSDVHNLAATTSRELLDALDTRPDAAAVSPMISLWPDTSRLWYGGGEIVRPLWVTRHPGLGEPYEEDGVLRRTGYFSGCLVMMRLAPVVLAGGFDERLFMYYDEADLATRLAERGWGSYVLARCLVAHDKPGRTLNANEAYFHARNSRVLVQRYEKGLRRYVGELAAYVLFFAQWPRFENADARRAYWRGLRESVAPLV